MKEELVLLEELQAIDRTLDTRLSEQLALKDEIEQMQQRLNSVKETLTEQMQQMESFRSERQEIENAISSENDNIKRSETNMKEIRTNKEFQAVGREINTARKQVEELEEQQLQLDSKIEELQTAISGCQSELDQANAAAESDCKEKQCSIDSITNLVEETSKKREKLFQKLPGSLSRRYTQLREQRRGQALAIVRDGRCMGCNMHLPPQLYNLLCRGDELHFCPHCQRIMILKLEQSQAVA